MHVVPLCFALLSKVLIKAQVLQSWASCKEFLVDQGGLHPLLIPGNAETAGTKQSFLSTGTSSSASPSAEGRTRLSLCIELSRPSAQPGARLPAQEP